MKNRLNIQRLNQGYSMFGGFRKVASTLNFGMLSPLMCDEVLENDSWRIRFQNHFDIAPMACRTFADIYYNQAAFFVSCSQLDKQFDNIRSMKKNHLGTTVPNMLSIHTADIIASILEDFEFKYASSKVTYRMDASGNTNFKELFDRSVYDVASGIDAEVVSYAGLDKDTVIKDTLSLHDDDFKIVFDDSTNEKIYVCYVRYNRKGSMLRKVFDGLGYKMPYLQYDFSDLTSSYKTISQINIASNDSYLFMDINPYPLLAYLKIYEDYFSMTSTKDEDLITLYLDNIYNRRSPYVSTMGALVRANDLVVHLLMVSIQLASDDVTRCTRSFYGNNNPFFSGTDTSGGDLFVNVPQVDSAQPGSLYSSRFDNMHTSELADGFHTGKSDELVSFGNTNSSSASNTISSFISNKLVNLVHRFLLTQRFAGGKASRRLRTFFGITDPIDDARHCIKCGESTIPIQISAETATANVYSPTAQDNVKHEVGQKYGVANAQGQSTYTYNNKNVYGYGIVVNWLSIRTIYQNRMPKYILKQYGDELYNGLFDGQGFAQCKSQFEVNCDSSDPSHNYVFGHEPLFDEYRNLSIDFCSGDVLRFAGMNSYLLPRNFKNIVNSKELYAEFSAVRSYRQASDEFDDVFVVNDGTVDPVVLVANVEVQANRHVVDSIHALAIPTGDTPIILQDNM